MKKLSILILGLLLSNFVQSQSYVPLLIDSLYTSSWTVDIIHGGILTNEYYSGFSYDSNDSLIQRRNPENRFTYSYSPDTVIFISETKDTSNNWNIFSKGIKVYENDKIKSWVTEKYENNVFENSILRTYHYDNEGFDTSYVVHYWNNGSWNSSYKKVKIFDSNGNNIEEGEYYKNSNGGFDYNKGKLFEYDASNHLIEEINVNSGVNGPYYTGRINWVYGNDDLLDTLVRCQYSFSTGNCNNVIMTTNDYSGQDTIVKKWFDWSNGNWVYYAKDLSFAGPELYSNQPDSIISYAYLPDSLSHIKFKRQYFQYQDLGNDSIYFKQEEYKYFEFTDEWKLTRITEEWYHLKMLVEVDNLDSPNQDLSIYPNPCRVGQNLNIKEDLFNQEDVEILIFDMQGKLISRNSLGNQTSLKAPSQEGIYSIIIRDAGQLIGVAKQVIIE